MSEVSLRHIGCRHNTCRLTAQWLIGNDETGLEVCGKHIAWGLSFVTGDRPLDGVGQKAVQVRTHSGWVRTVNVT